jgi:hypothetical protein
MCMCMCVYANEGTYVYVYVRKREYVCVCVCERERERERGNDCVYVCVMIERETMPCVCGIIRTHTHNSHLLILRTRLAVQARAGAHWLGFFLPCEGLGFLLPPEMCVITHTHNHTHTHTHTRESFLFTRCSSSSVVGFMLRSSHLIIFPSPFSATPLLPFPSMPVSPTGRVSPSTLSAGVWVFMGTADSAAVECMANGLYGRTGLESAAAWVVGRVAMGGATRTLATASPFGLDVDTDSSILSAEEEEAGKDRDVVGSPIDFSDGRETDGPSECVTMGDSPSLELGAVIRGCDSRLIDWSTPNESISARGGSRDAESPSSSLIM